MGVSSLENPLPRGRTQHTFLKVALGEPQWIVLQVAAADGCYNNATNVQISQIVSGGQTGVDRAALDVALNLKLPCGGWCPHGRLAEDGVLSTRYPLKETPSKDYTQRTEWNVRDSDGTLILTIGPLSGGTRLTKLKADELGKPCLVVKVDETIDVVSAVDWLRKHAIRMLNVAGPRGSLQPTIYDQAVVYLTNLLRTI